MFCSVLDSWDALLEVLNLAAWFLSAMDLMVLHCHCYSSSVVASEDFLGEGPESFSVEWFCLIF
jgi:hypothetical protein